MTFKSYLAQNKGEMYGLLLFLLSDLLNLLLLVPLRNPRILVFSPFFTWRKYCTKNFKDWRDNSLGRMLALRAADPGSMPRTEYGPQNLTILEHRTKSKTLSTVGRRPISPI